jgi:hypothetical protein
LRLSILSKGNAQKAVGLATYSLSSFLGLDYPRKQSRWLEEIVDLLKQPGSGVLLAGRGRGCSGNCVVIDRAAKAV